jgi:nitroreductase
LITQSFDLAINSSFSVHLVGDMNYIGYKYGDRAYRFMNLEAGHAMQNLYLTITAMGLGCVSSGGFFDYEFFRKIGLLQDDLFLLYESFVGKHA